MYVSMYMYMYVYMHVGLEVVLFGSASSDLQRGSTLTSGSLKTLDLCRDLIKKPLILNGVLNGMASDLFGTRSFFISFLRYYGGLRDLFGEQVCEAQRSTNSERQRLTAEGCMVGDSVEAFSIEGSRLRL